MNVNYTLGEMEGNTYIELKKSGCAYRLTSMVIGYGGRDWIDIAPNFGFPVCVRKDDGNVDYSKTRLFELSEDEIRRLVTNCNKQIKKIPSVTELSLDACLNLRSIQEELVNNGRINFPKLSLESSPEE